MPSAVSALVNPRMLQWAREQAGCDLQQASKIVGKTIEAVEAWESVDTDSRPTLGQAEKLAKAYRTPLAAFYLDQPIPDLEWDSVPEFRRIDEQMGRPATQSRRLRWMVRQAQERQAFAIDLLLDEGSRPLTWVGSAPLTTDPETLADEIRDGLQIGDRTPPAHHPERALDWWVSHVESMGALVSRYRPDGNRSWYVEPAEARGLSLCHPIAPYIVINSRDAPTARIFTLIHELAHLYFGRCGIDDMSDERETHSDHRLLERQCNRTAAAVLMPRSTFVPRWSRATGDVTSRVSEVANVFCVSRQAAAIRARSGVVPASDRLSDDEYDGLLATFRRETVAVREVRSRANGGGMQPSVRVLKDFGKRYTGLVFDAYAEGRLNSLDLANALDARVRDIDNIRTRLVRT